MMKKGLKKTVVHVMLLVIILAITLISCEDSTSPTPDDKPLISDIDISMGSEVRISLPSLSKSVDYEKWSDFYNDKYDLNINIDAYTHVKLDLDSWDIYYGASMTLYYDFLSYKAPKGSYNGIYLYPIQVYNFVYQSKINRADFLSLSTGKDKSVKETGQYIGEPFNEFEVVSEFELNMLEPYMDKNGDIWAIPYEHKLPEVKIRKYNKEILKKLGRDVPTNLDELYNLLIDVKQYGEISSVLPRMDRNFVFSGFEDIVCAFGIKAHPIKSNVFYSIQYDEESGYYVDLALTEKMKDCINYFTMLINDGLIPLEGGFQSSNHAFYNDAVFSVYENVDRIEDLDIPFSTKLYYENYEPHRYYLPSRYVYILGRDLEVSEAVNNVLNTLYDGRGGTLNARYGLDDNFTIIDDIVKISNENYSKAPKLVGEFPDSSYKNKQVDTLEKFKNQITNENLLSGYYKIYTPKAAALEIDNDYRWRNESYEQHYFALYRLVDLFYIRLGEHFFNKNRPTTDEFLQSYIEEAKKIISSDERIEFFFEPGERYQMQDIYWK